MIKFENVTSNEEFSEMVSTGEYSILKGEREIEIRHNLYNVPYIYGLRRISKNEFFFYAKNDEFFSCKFISEKTKITILHGEKNKRECKADRTLKQFMRILCLANSVLRYIGYDI